MNIKSAAMNTEELKEFRIKLEKMMVDLHSGEENLARELGHAFSFGCEVNNETVGEFINGLGLVDSEEFIAQVQDM